MSTEKCIQEEKELASLEPAIMNHTVLQVFLEKGKQEEIASFLERYLAGFQAVLGSEIFRGYLVLNARFFVLNYLESLGAEGTACWTEIHDMGTPSTRYGARSRENTETYLVKLLTAALLLRDREKANQGKRILRKALDYIDRNYRMEELSLNMAAEAVGLSPNYFSALFSQEMNITFIQYVTEKRMERARQLLRETKMRSIEIAPEIGYRDPQYFSYVFKKTQGCTPREYRHSDHTGEKL